MSLNADPPAFLCPARHALDDVTDLPCDLSPTQECMLRDAVLLKLLAKLLTICVIYADQTRTLMSAISDLLAANKLDPPPLSLIHI